MTLVSCLAPETSWVWVSGLHAAGRLLNFSQVPELKHPRGGVCLRSCVTFSSKYFSYSDGQTPLAGWGYPGRFSRLRMQPYPRGVFAHLPSGDLVFLVPVPSDFIQSSRVWFSQPPQDIIYPWVPPCKEGKAYAALTYVHTNQWRKNNSHESIKEDRRKYTFIYFWKYNDTERYKRHLLKKFL